MTERTTVKTCTKCGETKPHTDFHKHKASPDGLKTRCKECISTEAREYRSRPEVKARMAEYSAEYYEANRDKILAYQVAYQVEYHARPEVKVHTAKRKAAYYQANRDNLVARQAEYHAANPHVNWESTYKQRAKKFGFEPVIERFTRDDLIAKYGDKCAHCGGPFEELDHFPVAIVHGGAHTLENCKPSCAACNSVGTALRRREEGEPLV